jgi:hypothetical protein
MDKLAIQDRGNGPFYDTPLRMVENKKHELRARHSSHHENSSDWLANLEILEDLLRSYGAKSLHLFPVEACLDTSRGI